MKDRSLAVNAVASVLKDWREDGKLYVTPPSSKDVEVAQKLVYLMEKIMKGEDRHNGRTTEEG